MGHSLVALTVLCMCITVSVEAFMPGLATMRVGRSVRHSVNKKMGLRTARLTVSEERVAVEEDDIPASLAGFLKKSSAQDIQNRKTVIITGASSGIGLEAARQLANEVNPPSCSHSLHYKARAEITFRSVNLLSC